MARRFIDIVPLMEKKRVVDLYILSWRFIYLLCVPNGKEEWLVDLYLLCVPNGNE